MKTIREEKLGNATIRLLRTEKSYAGTVVRDGRRSDPRFGDDPDVLWRELLAEVNRGNPNYFGYEGAKRRFLQLFEDGFGGAQYKHFERDYKVAARDLLLATVPVDVATKAAPADCERIAKVYAKTNVLSQFEQARVRDVLKSQTGPDFVRSAAALTLGKVGEGLAGMNAAMRDFGQVSWPAATYLPFLWRPDTQMFLKPQVTRDFAERVGNSFANEYTARFEPSVYLSLLDLAAETEKTLAELQPADRIDIQSFIWIVGAYKDADAEAQRTQTKS